MRKLTITLTAAALALGLSAVAASAQTQSAGALSLQHQLKNATPIEHTACRGFGRWCGPGFVRACNRWRCWCRPCW